ncbi:ring finger protein [Cystoisospora suis]|uniref:Ring finger protein n=1 Tax=Cystoisospora suis TaxID=483139 RepID=A0A2C6L8Y1_9APIC|nr:ring finger protein [Cystoisospora suis]
MGTQGECARGRPPHERTSACCDAAFLATFPTSAGTPLLGPAGNGTQSPFPGNSTTDGPLQAASPSATSNLTSSSCGVSSPRSYLSLLVREAPFWCGNPAIERLSGTILYYLTPSQAMAERLLRHLAGSTTSTLHAVDLVPPVPAASSNNVCALQEQSNLCPRCSTCGCDIRQWLSEGCVLVAPRVPSYVSPAEFCDFLSPYDRRMLQAKVLHGETTAEYLVLLLCSRAAAFQAIATFNGVPYFQGDSAICELRLVKDVILDSPTAGDSDHGRLQRVKLARPPAGDVVCTTQSNANSRHRSKHSIGEPPKRPAGQPCNQSQKINGSRPTVRRSPATAACAAAAGRTSGTALPSILSVSSSSPSGARTPRQVPSTSSRSAGNAGEDEAAGCVSVLPKTTAPGRSGGLPEGAGASALECMVGEQEGGGGGEKGSMEATDVSRGSLNSFMLLFQRGHDDAQQQQQFCAVCLERVVIPPFLPGLPRRADAEVPHLGVGLLSAGLGMAAPCGSVEEPGHEGDTTAGGEERSTCVSFLPDSHSSSACQGRGRTGKKQSTGESLCSTGTADQATSRKGGDHGITDARGILPEVQEGAELPRPSRKDLPLGSTEIAAGEARGGIFRTSSGGDRNDDMLLDTEEENRLQTRDGDRVDGVGNGSAELMMPRTVRTPGREAGTSVLQCCAAGSSGAGGGSTCGVAVTVLCGHAFHSSCLRKWSDPSCPVCRYQQHPYQPWCCFVCGSGEGVRVCLLCGFTGCGDEAVSRSVTTAGDGVVVGQDQGESREAVEVERGGGQPRFGQDVQASVPAGASDGTGRTEKSWRRNRGAHGDTMRSVSLSGVRSERGKSPASWEGSRADSLTRGEREKKDKQKRKGILVASAERKDSQQSSWSNARDTHVVRRAKQGEESGQKKESKSGGEKEAKENDTEKGQGPGNWRGEKALSWAKRGHSRLHFEETSHAHALELGTDCVWDFVSEGYVHLVVRKRCFAKNALQKNLEEAAAAVGKGTEEGGRLSLGADCQSFYLCCACNRRIDPRGTDGEQTPFICLNAKASGEASQTLPLEREETAEGETDETNGPPKFLCPDCFEKREGAGPVSSSQDRHTGGCKTNVEGMEKENCVFCSSPSCSGNVSESGQSSCAGELPLSRGFAEVGDPERRDEAASTSHWKKVSGWVIEFNQMLAASLDSQRDFYEERLQRLKEMYSQPLAECQEAVRAAQQSVAGLQSQVTREEVVISAMEDEATALMHECERVTTQHGVLQELHRKLQQDALDARRKGEEEKRQLTEKIQQRLEEIEELRQQIRDVSFHVQASARLAEVPDARDSVMLVGHSTPVGRGDTANEGGRLSQVRNRENFGSFESSGRSRSSAGPGRRRGGGGGGGTRRTLTTTAREGSTRRAEEKGWSFFT